MMPGHNETYDIHLYTVQSQIFHNVSKIQLCQLYLVLSYTLLPVIDQ